VASVINGNGENIMALNQLAMAAWHGMANINIEMCGASCMAYQYQRISWPSIIENNLNHQWRNQP
jgi:hypothetical protein